MPNRIRFATAAQVVEAYPAAAEDLGEPPSGISPIDHISALAQRDELARAIVFAALALPKREAVWWGCIVLRGMGGLDGRTREGLRLAEAWVRHPGEDERRAAGAYAEAEYFEGAGALIALAACATGGSMTAAGLHATPSPEVSGRFVAMAVLQATDDDPAARMANRRCAIESARDFAMGEDGRAPWERRAESRRPKASAGAD